MNIINRTPAMRAHFSDMNHECTRIKKGRSRLSDRDQLIVSNYTLAVNIAGHYQGCGLEMEDLLGFAYIGLTLAADRFDPSRGVPFTAFAGYWIRKEVMKAINECGLPIRLPDHLMRKAMTIRHEQHLIFQKNGHEPSAAELAERLQMEESLVVSLLFATEPMLPFEEDE